MRVPVPVLLSPVLLSALFLAGCGDDAEPAVGTNVAAFVPPATQPAVPIPGQAQTTPLTAYVGRYPRDAVDGVGFFDRTQVATAIDGVVPDATLRRAIVRADGPTTPIFRVGDRVASWGCETGNCDDRHWTVLVDPDGRGEVCYHDTATMGTASRWYTATGPALRQTACPSGGGAVAPGRVG